MHIPGQMNTQSIMRITRLLFTETGTYNDMALRPYQAYADVPLLNAMKEATHGGTNLQPSVLAGIAGSVLRPATQSMGAVSIINNWDTPRLRFLMEVVHTDSLLGESVQYLTGYTDHVGVNWQTGSIDPRMQLYINNSIQTRRILETTAVGTMNRQAVVSAAQLLSGEYTPDFRNVHQNTFTMRPQDVFMTMGASVLREHNSHIIDTRQAFSAGNLKLSARSNTSAPSYLSRVMKGYRTAMQTADTTDDMALMMEKAVGVVPEPTLSTDPFLGLAQRRHTALLEHSWISYGELLGISPELDHIVTLVARKNSPYMMHHERGQSERWEGTTHETILATVLSHSVPSLMMDLMLTKLAFLVTNQTLDGSFQIQFAHATGFAQGVDLTPYLQLFEQRLVTEVLRDLTHNNQLGVSLSLQFDILGDTVLDISVNSGPVIRYVTPSFCDALMAPVITNNSQNLHALANDISTLVENLEVDHSVRHNQYSPQFQGPPGYNHGHSETL